MKEIWKDVIGYEGLYIVSNFGRVRSLDRFVNGRINSQMKKGVILSSSPVDTGGYPILSLNVGGKSKTTKTHRIVAIAFIPNPENKRTVNHKNGIKSDNRVENLEWCTHSENIIHSFRVLGRTRISPNKGKYGKLNKNSKTVFQYDIDYRLIRKHYGIHEASRNTGFSYSAISDCCNMKRELYKSYIWSFSEIDKNKQWL